MTIRQQLIVCALVSSIGMPVVRAQMLSAPSASESSRSESGKSEAAAASAHRQAEHDRIRHERDAIRARKLQDEAACYQRFAVEDCLRGVRAGARDAEGRLRTQEIELNDAERKEKAEERLRSIEDKQRSAPAPSTEARGDPDAVLRNGSSAPQSGAGGMAQRDQEAAARAKEQRDRVNKQTQEQAARTSTSVQRAAEARARHAQALQAAQERRARAEKNKADAAAQGHKPAAPLPTRPGSAPAP